MDDPLVTRRSFILGGAATAAAVAFPAWTIAATRRASRYTRLMRELDAVTRGPLVTRQHAGLPVAAQVWNQRFDGRSPYGVLYVANERDVQQAVRWAAHNHIPITARAGGHSYQGYSTIDSGLIVDLTNLATVIPRSGSVPYAHIGGGTALGNAYQALAPYGLTIPGGTCPTVGVGGLAQGGGIGWVARRWGPLSDNVQGFRIVTADGRLRTANAHTERDLYWACRGGGGGNFGIITSYDIRTHPTAPATHFVLRFPWSSAADAILAWQDWAYQTGPELFTLCSLVTNATGPNPTCQVSGQIFGDQTALAAELAPFLAQVTPSSRSITAASYASLVQFWAQCTHQAQEQCARRSQNPTGLIGRAFMWGKSRVRTRVATPYPCCRRCHLQLRWRAPDPEPGLGRADIGFLRRGHQPGVAHSHSVCASRHAVFHAVRRVLERAGSSTTRCSGFATSRRGSSHTCPGRSTSTTSTPTSAPTRGPITGRTSPGLSTRGTGSTPTTSSGSGRRSHSPALGLDSRVRVGRFAP